MLFFASLANPIPQESGLYYLKSRYYDPQICRFINADGFASTGQGFIGCNMFAYCGSNPANGKDASGSRSIPVEIEDELIQAPINGQNIKPYSDISYGVSTIGYSGCEAIAIYNFMLLIGDSRPFASIIAFMLNRFNNSIFGGWGKGGEWGATPNDINAYFISENIPVWRFNKLWKMKMMCSSPGVPGVFIISYWNEDLLEYGYHTIAVSYDGKEYLGYNQDTYINEPVHGDSLSDFMAGDWRFIYGFYLPKN